MRTADWFRFGEAFLTLITSERWFQERFLELFGGCRVSDPPPNNALVVTCWVSANGDSGEITVEFPGGAPLDQFEVCRRTLEHEGLAESPASRPEWRALVSPGHTGAVEFRDNTMIAHPDSLWPSLVVLLAIHRVQSIQRDVFFFHAASVGIKGRGLLLFGEKGAGKSTLSVALGERGHAFLGDETAAVRLSDRMLLPLRQRVSVRPGPQAPGMTRALEEGSFPRVHLADGTDRMRMSAAELFPDPAPVPVVAAVFLRSRSDATRVDPFTPTIGDLGLLAPYESASASADAPSVALRLLRLLGSLRCYLLFPGSVSHTVSAIEALMED